MSKIHIMNPKPAKRRKTTAKKKTATRRKRTAKKTMAKKRKTKRRRSAASPAPVRRRRRRRSNPAPARRTSRRRRRNPSLLGGGGNVRSIVKEWLPEFVGTLAVSWTVKRWSTLGGANGQLLGGAPMQSQFGGQSWTMGQYLIAILTAEIGSKFVGKYISERGFKKGAWNAILNKAMWTEVFSRSQWAQQTFGNYRNVSYTPGNRATWVRQGNQWASMQGLVAASPLDGLVQASPLDGTRRGGYGSILPSNTPPDEANRARWAQDGFTSPFNANYN